MNAPTISSIFNHEVTGELLYRGWQHTDTLQLDLYGSLPTADDGYLVESVSVSGNRVDICELLTGTQLEKMGEWLDFKDDTKLTMRQYANQAKYDAVQGPWEKNRGMY